MPPIPGNSIELGTVSGMGRPIELQPETRDKHLYIRGSTGTCKSKLLEHLIRQEIIAWRKSKSDWVIFCNVLRQREADPAVLVDNFIDAMAYVWGQSGTDRTLLFARWAVDVLRV